MYGVRIKHGLTDWQIVQQENGAADILVSGSYERSSKGSFAEIYARIVREETGESVIPWKKADVDTEQNQWKLCIPKVPSGGLYRMDTCMKEEASTPYEWAIRGDSVKHFGVGDLFVIAGQSNAAGYGKDPVYDAPMLGVHLFGNREEWELAVHPLNDSTRAKSEVNLEAVNSGSSPYLSFAKILLRTLGHPIGLIQSALGGSPLSRWNPKETGDLYENMERRIRMQGGKVKAVLWYQGCADTNEVKDAESYLERFGQMVEALRSSLHQPELPFFTIQLSRYLAVPVSEEEDFSWSRIREAQRQAARRIPNVSILPAIDGTLSDMIHNSSMFNLALGERLARQVLVKCYGKERFCDAPDLKTALLGKEKELTLRFAPVYDRLYASEIGADELPFTVEDEEGRIAVLAYEMTGRDEITLHLQRNPKGEAFVAAYRGQNPRCRCIVDFETHYPVLGFCQKIARDRKEDAAP